MCGAGLAVDGLVILPGDFNPPAPCGAGPENEDKGRFYVISIHLPRAGQDAFALIYYWLDA